MSSRPVHKQRLRLGGVPLLLYSGGFDAVTSALAAEIADASKLVFVLVDGNRVDLDAKLLTIEEDYDGDVDRAKAQIPILDLDRHFEGGYRAVNFLAQLDGGVRYASAADGFQRGRQVDHGVLLRKLGVTVFDDAGRVRGSRDGSNTLFLYSMRMTPRADFAWKGAVFRRVTFDLAREAVRHTVIGGRAVMIAETDGTRAMIATAGDVAAFLRGAIQEPYLHRLDLAGRVVDLSLATKGPGDGYTLFVTTDRRFVPVRVAFRGDAPAVILNLDAAVERDGTVRDLGGVVKVTDAHVVFFGQTNVTFAPIAGLRDPYRAFFRGDFSTA